MNPLAFLCYISIKCSLQWYICHNQSPRGVNVTWLPFTTCDIEYTVVYIPAFVFANVNVSTQKKCPIGSQIWEI